MHNLNEDFYDELETSELTDEITIEDKENYSEPVTKVEKVSDLIKRNHMISFLWGNDIFSEKELYY